MKLEPVTTGSALGMYSDFIQTNDVSELYFSITTLRNLQAVGVSGYKDPSRQLSKFFWSKKKITVSSGFRKHLGLRHWKSEW